MESIEQNFNRGEQNEPSSQLKKKPADVAVKEVRMRRIDGRRMLLLIVQYLLLHA